MKTRRALFLIWRNDKKIVKWEQSRMRFKYWNLLNPFTEERIDDIFGNILPFYHFTYGDCYASYRQTDY